MKNDLCEYNKYLDEIIKKNSNINKDLLEEVLTNIKFFQHERLVHLIVTVFVGIICVLFLGFGLITENLYLIILFFLTFILFIPYIFHYYYLENGTQSLYKKYFILKEKM